MSKKLESAVKKQAFLLEKKMPDLIKEHLGKFVAFFEGAIIIEETHEGCLTKAEKAFGRDQGFVINEVSNQPLFVSALVKF
jgi:hypothetical protein